MSLRTELRAHYRHLYNIALFFSSDVYGNTVSEQWKPWSTEHSVIHSVNLLCEKGPWPIFIPFVSSSSLCSFYTRIFSLASLAAIDLIPLYAHHSSLVKILPKIQGFKFTLLLISFNPSSHSSPCLCFDPNLISEHLVQGNSSCQQGQSSPQTPTQVAFSGNWYSFCSYMFVFNTIWRVSSVLLCVLALSALLLTLANIEM